ncbi:hypothetical protein BN14_10989 [Rhizoctonia solani AG-1 IB]|uniref:Uncharacterized protein n=1 Tax=Thanatephorus cucumeris (strain AG1-IB / isolate 7/3/14) TaxID=1108050 RepID=M5CGW8_THACB|nr:hypothetical protein BN14_10989 [Rhizoctonia solani AG-1 IB]
MVGNTIYGSAEVSFPDFPPLPVVWCPKPHNFTPGKGANSHVGIMVGLTRDEHRLMLDYTKHALTVTPGINMMLTIRHQKSQKIIHDLILTIANNCKEWAVFEPEDYWPLRGYVYLALKYYKDRQLRNIARASRARLMASSTEDGGMSRERAQKAAHERGKASARARALKVTAHTLVESADNQHSITKGNNTNNSDQYHSEHDINNACDNYGADEAEARILDSAQSSDAAVDDMVHDISSMSICVSNDDNLPMSDDESEDTVLPPSLLAPCSMEKPVASTVLAPPGIPTNSAPELGAEIQAALLRVSHISPAERAKLPPHIQLLLAALNPSSVASTPSLLSGPGPIRPSIPNSASLAIAATALADPTAIALPPAPPAHNLVSITTPTDSLAHRPKGRPRPQARIPLTHSTSQSGSAYRPILNSTTTTSANVPSPVAAALASGTGVSPVSRLSSSFKTIDQIELGPTALEVDADDYLSDMSSVSDLNQPVETDLQNGATSRRVEGFSQSEDSRAAAASGVSQGAKESGSSNPVQTRRAGRDTVRELVTTIDTITNAKGKGKARGRTEFTSESTVDSTQVSSGSQRVTRSRKNA